MVKRPHKGGFTLLEVLVAFVLLELGLLGSVGLLLVASRSLTRAVLVERAAGEAAAVADSLSRNAVRGVGEVLREGWRVAWEPVGGGSLRVMAMPADGDVREPLAVLFLP